MIFETEHLRIRKFKIEDAKRLFENHLEADVRKWIPNESYNEVEGNPDEVEIGYSICKKYSGKGYATELVKAMTEFVVETFAVNVLYGRVMHGNNASVRVLEKNGYEFVAEELEAEDDPYGNGMLIYKKEY